MKKRYKYIRFELVDATTKTTVWSCLNNRNDGELGLVKWYAPWRQYCFFPTQATVFNRECLENINSFISDLMNERDES